MADLRSVPNLWCAGAVLLPLGDYNALPDLCSAGGDFPPQTQPSPSWNSAAHFLHSVNIPALPGDIFIVWLLAKILSQQFCLSARLCVLSHSRILSKQLNILSTFFRHPLGSPTILIFSELNVIAKFQWGCQYVQTGRRNLRLDGAGHYTLWTMLSTMLSQVPLMLLRSQDYYHEHTINFVYFRWWSWAECLTSTTTLTWPVFSGPY